MAETETLAGRFATTQSPQIEWEGETAYGVYEINPVAEVVVVEFLEAKDAPVQGLTLKAVGGVLVVDDIEATGILLWRDTAPNLVSVRVKSKPGKTRLALKIWNIWRGNVGGIAVTQAWLGNAGMRIDKIDNGNKFIFRCSDGLGEVNFNDLVARVTIG